MSVGVEWIVDALGCRPELLSNPAIVEGVMTRVLRDLELRVVGKGVVHAFGGAGGVTALYLLTESHLACHTYPEAGVATVNLYCCRPRESWPWRAELAVAFGATAVTIRQATRGTLHESDERLRG